MNGLIYVSKGHIPNLVPLEPLLHVEKFCGGGGGWVSKLILVIDLGPLPTSGPIKGDSRTKFKTFFERKKNYDIKNLSNTPSIKQCNYLLFCIVYQSIFHLYKHFTY